jgi:hypothetical protein
MSPIWKQMQIFRNLPAEPEYLTITAWGRQFRVQPSKALRQVRSAQAVDVTIEVVGPSLRPERDLPPAMRVVHVDVQDDQSVSSRPPPPPYVELAYDEDDDVTLIAAPTPVRAALSTTPSKGGSRGT